MTHIDFMYSGMVLLPLSLLLVYIIKNSFSKTKDKLLFVNSYYILIGAVLLFLIGALVETIVLGNVDTLNKIYSASFLYGIA